MREEACWLLVLMLMLILLLCCCLPPPLLLLCEGCGQCTPSPPETGRESGAEERAF